MTQSNKHTIEIQQLKDGAVITDLDGTVYKYLGSKQVITGYDSPGAEFAEVKRVYRSERLMDKRVFDFGPRWKVILLEGEKAWN